MQDHTDQLVQTTDYHHFFGKGHPAIPERVCMHILSFLSKRDREACAEQDVLWKTAVAKTENELIPLGYLKKIPNLENFDFSQATLTQLTISPLSGGMTNCSFFVHNWRYNWIDKTRPPILEPHNKWVLRIPGVGSSVFITRKDEKHNAQQASKLNLNVQIDFFNADTGLQLTRYLDKSKPLTQEALKDNVILCSVGLLLKKLHASELFNNEIPVFSRNQTLYNALKANLNTMLPDNVEAVAQKILKVETLIERFSIDLKPCHNDTTPANFLLYEEGSKTLMIDYEYSGNNDCLWDLVYFSMEAKLSMEQERILLGSYFGTYNDSILAWFELYKPIVEWWITLWSWTQVASNANACDQKSYTELANTCYKRTMECLDSTNLQKAMSYIESTLDPDSSTKIARNF